MPVRKSVLATAMACVVAVAGLAGCAKVDGGTGGKGKDSARGSGQDGRQHGASSGRDNGLEKKSAPQIAKEAVGAMRSASSLRMRGSVTTGGDRLGLNLALTKSGNCTGAITSGSGGAAQVRKKGGDYVKANNSFWKAVVHDEKNASMAAALLNGRWLKVPHSAASSTQAGAAGADFTSLCDLSALLAELKPADMAKATKGHETTVDGLPAIPLSDKRAGGTATAYVATKGKPYVLKLEKRGGGTPSSLRFGDFDKPVHVSTPPKGDTVDLGDLFKSALGGGGSGN
jgi:hypothetical protein